MQPVQQGADRGEAVVAGADLVAALVFEMVEERADQRRVQLGDVQLAGLRAGAGGGEGEQQPERVAVAGDGVCAGAALADEPVAEERLQQRRERAHDPAPHDRVEPLSRRAAASCISCGTAERYQLFRGRNNWYQSASPELLDFASRRVDQDTEGKS